MTMEKLFKQIGDEVTEFTAEEYAQRAKDIAEAEAAAKVAEEKAEADGIARAALLSKLGITADEAKLLLG
jgi:hypothetical protein